jgi:tRNA(Ile)-lysidine synthase
LRSIGKLQRTQQESPSLKRRNQDLNDNVATGKTRSNSARLDSRGRLSLHKSLRYHALVHSLAQRLLSHIRQQELLKAGDRVGVAVSGGIDSVALLRLLLELRGELGIVLSVVHFNHKLRGAESDADQEFVVALARAHDLEFFCDSDDVSQHAAEEHVSLETAARELRYGFFRYLLEGEEPQGLKPDSDDLPLRGAEALLFHGSSNQGCLDGVAGSRALSNRSRKLNKILTGHTLDDQAETVLMRMIRGAGLRGLGGIHPRIQVESGDDEENGEVRGEIVRPLLAFRHLELEHYLNEIGQSWREDSSNADDSFTRNRVRKLLVPLLEKEFNPSVAKNLAELAEIARGEEDYWENEAAGWMGRAVHWSQPQWARDALSSAGLVQIALSVTAQVLKPTSKIASDGRAEAVPFPNRNSSPDTSSLRDKIDDASWLVMNASVDLLWFLGEPAAVQRRLIKAIGEEAGIPLEFRHVEEILRFAPEQESSGKGLSLPLGWKIVLEPGALVFVTPDLRKQTAPQDYEYSLPVPGQTSVPEAGLTFEARLISAAAAAGYNPELLLDAESLPTSLTVRNWRPGDRFWPPHTKAPKKIKELLQKKEPPISQPERRLWPVVAAGDEIIWLRGFSIPAKFQAKPGRDAILIVESALAEKSLDRMSLG